MSNATSKGLETAKVNPSFLHTNAQNHLWPFSAIAELIDNAQDPDVCAEALKIDYKKIYGKPCLVFQDNGLGMDLDHLIKMLSFGFNEKNLYTDPKRLPIGRYGNGFKSGSMRLAKDALVMTVHKSSNTACCGLLSQTMCEYKKLDTVKFPMLEYRMPGMARSDANLDMDSALELILEFSPYISEDDLKHEFYTLRSQKKKGGTKIVLFNLQTRSDGKTELDFKSDPGDIRNEEMSHDPAQADRPFGYRQSLRRYCSILYITAPMTIQINGKEIERFSYTADLKEIKETSYKPTRQELRNKQLHIAFGREKLTGTGKLEDHGIMFYHRNRLIKPFIKLPCQSRGVGSDVVGIVDVTDFLDPIHFKQDFDTNSLEYGTVIKILSTKMEQYASKSAMDVDDDNPENSEDSRVLVKCSECQKRRRVPKELVTPMPKKWRCFLNPDTSRNRCEYDEEDGIQEIEMPGPDAKGKRKAPATPATPAGPKRVKAEGKDKAPHEADPSQSTAQPVENRQRPTVGGEESNQRVQGNMPGAPRGGGGGAGQKAEIEDVKGGPGHESGTSSSQPHPPAVSPGGKGKKKTAVLIPVRSPTLLVPNSWTSTPRHDRAAAASPPTAFPSSASDSALGRPVNPPKLLVPESWKPSRAEDDKAAAAPVFAQASGSGDGGGGGGGSGRPVEILPTASVRPGSTSDMLVRKPLHDEVTINRKPNEAMAQGPPPSSSSSSGGRRGRGRPGASTSSVRRSNESVAPAGTSDLQRRFRRNVHYLLNYLSESRVLGTPRSQSEEGVEEDLQLVLGVLGVEFE